MPRARFERYFVLVILATLPIVSHAQGTIADYERAERMGRRGGESAYRSRVRPEWNASGDQFWYRVQTASNAYEFIRVDAKSGKRAPAFDHNLIAEALSKALGREVTAANLPVTEINLDAPGGAIVIYAGGSWWRLGDDKTLAKVGGETKAAENATLTTARASTRTGEETELVILNASAGEVSLFWLDNNGERQPYGTIAPGAERRQHTFAGHVWQVVDAGGHDLARLEAREQLVTFKIDGSPQRPGGERREGTRRPRTGSGRSPDDRYRAFVRDHNVFLTDTKSNETFALSTGGSENDAYQGRFYWSPDSKHLVVIQEQPEEKHTVSFVNSSPRDQVQPKLFQHQYLKPGDRIAHARPKLFDVERRVSISIDESLFTNPWSITEIRWDADSTRFSFIYNQRGHQVLRIVSVDAAEGRSRAIVDETSRTFIDYAHKSYSHWVDGKDELIWMSERDGWNHLWLIDTKTGEVKNQITQGPWVVRRVEQVDEENRQIWFFAGGARPEQDPYYLHFCRVNFDGSGFVILTEGDGTHAIEFSPDRRYFFDRWSRVDLPPVTELRRSADGALMCKLEESDASALAELGLPTPERFVAKGRDGVTDIYGVIIKPSHFDASKKYPVIEQIYAGPQGAFVPKSWSGVSEMQAMAELGFVLVQIDGMGTNWRSKAFHDVCWKNLADAGFPDRIAWMKAAAAERPWMDLSRVGLYGGSAGGQNAMRGLLDFPEFYKAGAADCGCHDNRMDKIWWNELWMGWPVGPEYAASSNVVDAHKLRGKLLLSVGEMDRNVDPASTMQVVAALVRANKDFELLVIPGADHGAGSGPYGRHRRMDFFVRHLLGVEPRAH